MVAWKRFPVPEFDYEPFVEMEYEKPDLHTASQIADMAGQASGGDGSACGGYAIEPSADLLEKFSIKGDDCYAVAAVLPAKPVHLLGRSHAWRIQRALVLDSPDPGSAKIVHDWTTPRPMNSRLGPDDGVTLDGGVNYILTGNKYADHWLCNRTIIQNDWDPGDGRKGFRILANTDPELDDFHDCYLAFTWAA